MRVLGTYTSICPFNTYISSLKIEFFTLTNKNSQRVRPLIISISLPPLPPFLSLPYSLSLSFNYSKTCLASPSLIENVNSSWHKRTAIPARKDFRCHTITAAVDIQSAVEFRLEWVCVVSKYVVQFCCYSFFVQAVLFFAGLFFPHNLQVVPMIVR